MRYPYLLLQGRLGPLAALRAAFTVGALVLLGGCTNGHPLPTPAPVNIARQPLSVTVTAPATATFSVAAVGYPPLTYQWYLGTTAIPGATTATYTTPATTTAMNGNIYTVIVSNGFGDTMTSAPAVLTVNAAGTKIMFFTSNWGNDSVMITDDLFSLANNATASPRVVVGSNVPITDPDVDSLAVDGTRGLIYVSDRNSNEIFMWNSATTVVGNIMPSATIYLTGTTPGLNGISLDSGRDILYVADHADSFTGAGSIFIIKNASLKGHSVTADAVLNAPAWSLYVDPVNDRLYVADLLLPGVDVFDNASTLTSGATPSRTLTLSAGVSAYAIWVDGTTDRLYFGSRDASNAGNNLFIFAGASTLSGTKDADTDSVARIALGYLMNVMVDNQDHLYIWPDSATAVMIYDGASTLSGNVTAAPDLTINGVVQDGYGMGYLSY